MGFKVELVREGPQGQKRDIANSREVSVSYQGNEYTLQRNEESGICRMERESDHTFATFTCKEAPQDIYFSKDGIEVARTDGLLFRISPLFSPSLPDLGQLTTQASRFSLASQLIEQQENGNAAAILMAIAEDSSARLPARLKAAEKLGALDPVWGITGYLAILKEKEDVLPKSVSVDLFQRILQKLGTLSGQLRVEREQLEKNPKARLREERDMCIKRKDRLQKKVDDVYDLAQQLHSQNANDRRDQILRVLVR